MLKQLLKNDGIYFIMMMLLGALCGVIACTLLYLMYFFGLLTFAEMKISLPIFFIFPVILSLYAAIKDLVDRRRGSETERNKGLGK